MKRIIIFALSILSMVFLGLSITAAPVRAEASGNPTIYVESIESFADKTVNVNIKVSGNTGIAGATINVTYDPSLTLTEAVNGEAFSTLSLSKSANLASPCTFLWDSAGTETDSDGVILTLTFTVPENAVAGSLLSIDISYEEGEIIDVDWNDVTVEMISGGITIIDYVPGDVTGDRKVNVKDVNAVRQYIVGGYNVELNKAAADVNDDGNINVKDVNMLRQYIVGGYGVELKPSTHFSSACAHTFEHTAAKAATCEAAGNGEYYYCTKCKKYFSDSQGKTEITLASTVIAALGHSYGEWTVTKAATCTEKGEEKRVCSHDNSHVETRERDMIEHIYENGYCVNCGAIKTTIGLNYQLNNDGVSYSITGIGSATDTDIVIPAIYNDKPVTSIGEWAFSGCSGLTSIEIPDGVTSIGQYAFRNCSGLTSITIPFVGATKDGTENTHFGYIFGSWSYADSYVPSSLKTVIITSATSIGQYAFRNCSGLTSITIPDSVTSIGDYAFYGCSGLTSIEIPDGVTSIDYEAFRDCSGLTSVTFGENSQLTSIGEYAFNICSSLTSIEIPADVTSIGNYAFYYCNGLTSITFNGTITEWQAISKGTLWNSNVPLTCVIHCTDGDIAITDS